MVVLSANSPFVEPGIKRKFLSHVYRHTPVLCSSDCLLDFYNMPRDRRDVVGRNFPKR
jgi:hypothetical protein